MDGALLARLAVRLSGGGRGERRQARGEVGDERGVVAAGQRLRQHEAVVHAATAAAATGQEGRRRHVAAAAGARAGVRGGGN